MSSIRVDGSSVVVSYNKAGLTQQEVETLHYAFTSFGFLLPKSQELSFGEFAELIKKHYRSNARVDDCVSIIEKARVLRKVACEFMFKGDRVHDVFEIEDEREVGRVIGRKYSGATDIRFMGATCSFQKSSHFFGAVRALNFR